MEPPGNEAAAPGVGSRNGGEDETKGDGFEGKTYGGPVIGSIPSPEHAGRLAVVVRRADRLYAVDHRPEIAG